MKGKLYYFYSCMGAMKSGTLITKYYQFQNTSNVDLIIAMKPREDTRTVGTISSRAIKTELPCYVFDKDKDLHKFVFSLMGQHLAKGEKLKNVIVFVDEINFATKEQVKQLFNLTRSQYNVKVFAYGLKTNYLNELFESSQQLLIMADEVAEIKSMCSTCTNKATTHLRYVNGKPVFEGNPCIVGDLAGEERYVSVCQECWHRVYNESHNVGIDVGDFESKTINEPISSAQRGE